MSYYLAPSLVALRAEVNARWPHRSKASDGWIGDASHSARVSDHNPDWSAGGVVRALDVTASGINPAALVAACVADQRTNYVIHAGRIYTRATGFQSRAYTGPNPHYTHVHVSIRHGATWENDRRAWFAQQVSQPTPIGGTVPTAPGVTTPTPVAPTPAPLDPFGEDDTMYERAIIAAYRKHLGRTPGASEVDDRILRVASSDKPAEQLRAEIAGVAGSGEAAAYRRRPVVDLYRTLLGRTPSDAEADHWLRESGGDIAKVEAGIKASPEYARRQATA